MTVEAEQSIIELLEKNTRLNFGDLKARSGHPPQDVRRSLKRLIDEDSRVYVEGVEDKTKYYALKN